MGVEVLVGGFGDRDGGLGFRGMGFRSLSFGGKVSGGAGGLRGDRTTVRTIREAKTVGCTGNKGAADLQAGTPIEEHPCWIESLLCLAVNNDKLTNVIGCHGETKLRTVEFLPFHPCPRGLRDYAHACQFQYYL